VFLVIIEKAMQFTRRIVAPLATRIPAILVIGMRMEGLLIRARISTGQSLLPSAPGASKNFLLPTN
jgi:hypothetical protein